MSAAPSASPVIFEFWRSSIDHLWYWHLKTSGNQKLAQGEAYTSKAGCLKAIELVKSAGQAPVQNLSPQER